MFALTYTLKMKEMWKYWLKLWLKPLYVIFENIFRFLVINYTIKPKTHSNIWLHSGLQKNWNMKIITIRNISKLIKHIICHEKKWFDFYIPQVLVPLKLMLKNSKTLDEHCCWIFYPPSLVSVQSQWIVRLGALNSNFNVKTTL